MIRAKIEYNGRITEITFPHQDKVLHEMLGEDGTSLKRGYVREIVEPRELALLENATHEIDEINYLAKRLDSFDQKELDCFCSAAQHEQFDDLQDLINLTFNLERYSLIQDLRSMESVGRTHYLSVHGGMSAEEACRLDFAQIGRDLLATGKGQYTEHGILFVNEDIEFKMVYDGQVFPPYHYMDDSLFTVKIECNDKCEYVYLPDDDLAITKALTRLSAPSPAYCTYTMDDFSFENREWLSRFEMMLTHESIFDINALAAEINFADIDFDKLTALVEYAEDESAQTITKLAHHCDDFAYIENVADHEEVGRYIIENDEDYELQPELEDFFKYDEFGEYIANSYYGGFTENGFVYSPTARSLEQIIGHDQSIAFGGN